MANYILHASAEQYRERAKFVRYTAQAVRSDLLRQHLIELATEYDGLAKTAERGSDVDAN